MAFAALLKQETQRPSTRTIDRILASLDEQDRAEVLDAIRNPSIGGTAIARALWSLAPDHGSRGVPYSSQIVVVHPEYRFGE